MAAPARASSSSVPCRTSPNLKKSEICDPIRRSFSGNPFTKPSIVTNPRTVNPNTPANSPSDFPRRYSTGRESVASWGDSDKENSKDQNPKPTRVRSPAPSKGTKNFMSPTISAASKMHASPRKKILVERNEPGRSSVSFCDVKSVTMEDNESTPEIALKKKKVSFSDVKSIIMDDESTPEIGLNQKKVSFSDVKSIVMEDNVSASEISLNEKKVSFANVTSAVIEDKESNPLIALEQKNVDVPRDSSSSNQEHEEPLKSNLDFEYKESTNDYDWLPETVTDEKDSVNVDPTFNISPRVYVSPSCPVLAPLDADPSLPPYDPKINYLSPRPQFLHYRPNPRTDLYGGREGKQLEDHFVSESYSDTDATEETQSQGSQRESEDISLEETSKEEEEEEEELHVSEAGPIAPDMVEESVEGKRMSKSRFSTRSKFMSLLLVLAFAYFSIQAANSPAFVTPRLEELSLLNFHVPPEVSAFVEANFDRFTQNLQHWSVSFWSYISSIISSSREVHKLGPFQHANLSLLIEDDMSERNQMFDHEPAREIDAGTKLFDDRYYRKIEAEEEVDEDDHEQEDQEDEACENFEPVEEPDEVQQRIEAMIEPNHLEAKENKGDELAIQFNSEHQSNVNLNDQPPSRTSQASEIQPDVSKSGVAEGDDVKEIAESETMLLKEEKSDNPKIAEVQQGIEPDLLVVKDSKGDELANQFDSEHQSNVNLNVQPNRIPQASEVQPDGSKSGVAEGDDLNEIAESETMLLKEQENSENPTIEASTDNSLSSEVVTTTFTEPEDQYLTKNMMAFSLLVMCLLAAAAFIHTKREKPSMPKAVAVPVQPPILSKKSGDSPVSVSSMDTIRERLSSRNWQREVVMAERSHSCASEMSTCQKTSSSSSHSKKELKESNEYQSQERKPRKNYRRESLASSDYSMGSPSYGSFTTYEKLASKHGGDEEIVTPVRRSSRIKSQVTSP